MPEASPMSSPERYASSLLPTAYGDFTVSVYRNARGEENAVVIAAGVAPTDEPVFVRIHSECFTGEVLGSLRCDCKPQLEYALGHITERGRGLVVYLRQEGRGIGLGNKIRAYALQDQGADTVEANHLLGLPNDLRDFREAAAIIHGLGLRRLLLNTNNPEKIKAMEEAGLEISEVIPSLSPVNPHNRRYLETKVEKMHHTGLRALLEKTPAVGHYPWSVDPEA